MTTRFGRAHSIVATGQIVKARDAWFVPSQSSDAVYRVGLKDGALHCTCADFQRRGEACKHLLACGMIAQAQQQAMTAG